MQNKIEMHTISTEQRNVYVHFSEHCSRGPFVAGMNVLTVNNSLHNDP